MCGIVGTTEPADFPRLSRMLHRIAHRGPDDQGEFVDCEAPVALGMRRLSILDLEGGHQPLSNEDGTVWVVFNGEIYNSPQLREQLLTRGHQFRTSNSDTEVLVHLYEEHGDDLVEQLNGMFAFVIYDQRRRRLLGARDRLGIKPLYFSQRQGRFAFASELKSLCCLSWISQDIDFNSLYHFLSTQFVPAPQSILRDVQKLSAGHRFTYDLQSKSLDIERYWQLPVRPNQEYDAESMTERLRAKLVESVKRRTLSDVPIACSLSGGLDSSAIVGILADANLGPVRTYSLGFSGAGEEQYDELALARKVAARWDTEHHEIIIDPRRLLEDLSRMSWHLDEPYAGGLPSWFVYEQIGADCKVALTGTGGDELFGNYRKWALHERTMLGRAWRELKRVVDWKRPSMLRDYLRTPHGHLYHGYLPDCVKDTLLLPTVLEGVSERTESRLERLWQTSGAGNARDAVAAIDFQMQLPEEFLAVTDRFSMAHGVEARVPFLDHELVELAYTVPAAFRTNTKDPKFLARRIAEPYLPPELLSAPKRGFRLPLPLWTRRELREIIGDFMSPAALARQGIFSERVWDTVVKPHLDGKQERTEQVWTLFMFQLWQHEFARTAFDDSAADRLSPVAA